ncbi:NarK/NasA family nitrate transporter [Paracoccus sp. R12_1]|jgi:MFS transporter, NNP family, nitrate/nitrite transporter|uniref:MFS transporter n=1 Tax=unclassified Paracoccus (in: a-proteobacteria) TaxID=2688777 RepID=UPI001ADB14E3|nr:MULTISPECIES: nitrate/nitrite transporter [unclassified Paracoccus (in: a-proteobacteria)]MBO9457395.1 NarK/NasA family nitrate transporter [Paracoccus sp. R12_2]MBO9488672.1 NarK/NasA family nitrate transporter [Paracoccus sp. R12_1]
MSTLSQQASRRALVFSTFAFTVCFAVWTIFSIIGIQIAQQLSLTDTQFGFLVGLPILTGSLTRIVLGIATDRLGGRLVYTLTMLTAALSTLALSWATTYPQMLVAALGVGVAGGSFAVGVAYVSRFYGHAQQGTALGIFGVGNVGAAVTKFAAPFVMVALGWQATAQIWALGLAVTAIIFWIFSKDDPVTVARQGGAAPLRSLKSEFAPLRNLQVWRFSAYYFFSFGAFVALALWLPHYLIGVYGLNVKTAGMVGAAYSIPASIFRAYGGVLSDRIGARKVLYATFAVALVATAILSVSVSLTVFLVVIFALGFVMSLGKAAVYKHIPTYYPQNVGAVGGLVGMIGGLGGFILPLVFGGLKDATGQWSSCFMVLFVLVAACAIWMHAVIRRADRPSALQTA